MTSFAPSTPEGHAWKAHAAACSLCIQDGRLAGARCDEGHALCDAYLQSLGEQRGDRDWRGEMLAAWGPVAPELPPALTIMDQQPQAPPRVMHLLGHPLGEDTRQVVTACGVTTWDYRTTSNRRDVRCLDCEVMW